jgi:glycosyltransferase involved in cell wall biosynthesis
MPQIYVVIAAYNEELQIGAVLESLLKINKYNIIVVNDGSQDNTAQIVSRYPVILLSHRINRGQGAALATGTQYALSKSADIIVHFDADGQFLAQEIEKVIAPIIAGSADVVFGSKFLQANSVPLLKKILLIKPAIIFNNLFTGIKLTDVHNGFRALSSRAASKINIRQDAMAHASEIVAQVKEQKLSYQEVPVTVIYKEFGQGLVGGLKILRDLFIKKIIS